MFKSLNELERETVGERRPLWKRIPLPLKFFVLFGFVSYAVQMYLTYFPSSFPRPGGIAKFVLAYSVCPACILTPTVDLSRSTMAYFVGPIDAIVHGAVGAAVGYVVEAFF